MQDANGRQYKREMASFEVGSENQRERERDGRIGLEGRASAGARWSKRGREDRKDQERWMRGTDGWSSSEGRKRSGACHVRNGDDSSVCRTPLAFISDESNSIARIPGDPVLCVFTAAERDRLRDKLLR